MIQLLRECRLQKERVSRETLPHVLLVVDQLPRSLGGGERIVLTMAEQLPAYGYRASILTFAAHPESTALIDPPAPIYLLPLTRTYDLQALRGAFALRRFLQQEQVVLVHTCFESSDLWAGGVTKLLSRAKLVWNRRDMGILRSGKHFAAYKRLARLPDAVFAVSEQVQRYSVEVDGVPAERLVTIRNGLDLARWKHVPGQHRPAQPVIATLGNIRRVKGHDVLLHAFAQVRQEFPAARLVLGGAVLEPEFMAELNAIVARYDMENGVCFVGAVSEQQAFLNQATLFVLPSRSEGFSNAIVEAMAASLPVVATDVGGNGEAVENGRTGYIVPSEQVQTMAEAMLRLLRDPESAAAMGAAGRTVVLERFTTEAMMGAVCDAFDRLLQRS